MFVDDSIQRIFRSEEEGMEEAEILEEVQEEGEQSEQGEEDYDAYGNVEIHVAISRYHNSIVGHLSGEHIEDYVFAWVRLRGCAKMSPCGFANVVFVRRSNISVS